MDAHLLHNRRCEHCQDLEETGECCHDVWCSCRNVYREGIRNELAESIMAEYYWRRGERDEARRIAQRRAERDEARRIAPDYRLRRSE